MCLIIHRGVSGRRGRGANVPNDILDHNRTSNPDGFGIAWRDPKSGLTYQKFGPDDYAAFYGLLKAVDRDNSVEYVAHYRWATHGAKTQEQAHPFEYVDPEGNRVLVFHNGIISAMPKDGPKPDTQVFVERILTGLPPRWWHDRPLLDLVEAAIDWSRITIMTDEETFTVHKYLGEDEGGIWYSTYPRPRYASKTYSYTPKGSTVVAKIEDKTHDENGWPKIKQWRRSDIIGGEEWKSEWEEWDEIEERRKPAPKLITATAASFSGSNITKFPNEPGIMYHSGHRIAKLTGSGYPVDNEGGDEEHGSIICEDCQTIGDYYVVDGKFYPDIAHLPGLIGEDDAELALNEVELAQMEGVH